jgi:hypothetical protein
MYIRFHELSYSKSGTTKFAWKELITERYLLHIVRYFTLYLKKQHEWMTDDDGWYLFNPMKYLPRHDARVFFNGVIE